MPSCKVGVLLVLLVASVSAGGGGDDVSYDATGPVVVLGPDDFNNFTASSTGVFVEFYAPWCGHCKSLKPIWVEAAEKHAKKFGALDADKHSSFAEQFGVQGFPTIAYFVNGQKYEYEDERTVPAFEAFDKKMNRPRFTLIESEKDRLAFSTENAVNIQGYFKDPTSEGAVAFKDVANKQFLTTAFGLVTGAALGSQADGTVITTIVGQAPEVWNKEGDLAAWTKGSIHPLLDELNQQTFNGRVMGSTVGNFILFIDPKNPEVSDPLKTVVKGVAGEFKGKAQFFHVDGNEYSDFARNVDLGETLPGLVVLDITSQNHFVYDLTNGITEVGVRQFVNDFVGGKLVRELKSEATPEPASVEGLTTLTGKTFETIALNDDTKDVLVEFYAPWCGHCKKLAPIYKKIASYLSPISSLVIAQINMDANEVAKTHSVEGFPTIRLYPAKDKANPVVYTGGRTFKDIVKFVKKSASIPFELPKVPEADAAAEKEDAKAEKPDL